MALVGAHQRANAAAAAAAALALRAQGWAVPDAAVAAGLAAAALPARFQVTRAPAPPGAPPGAAPPYVVLDGAHTPEAAAALAVALREAFPAPAPLALVVAMAGDKQHRDTLAALRAARPGVAVFTAVPVGGSTQRSAQPGARAAWRGGGVGWFFAGAGRTAAAGTGTAGAPG
jgi:folylpolyglutamate synthase/dihydropteroate synthase